MPKIREMDRTNRNHNIKKFETKLKLHEKYRFSKTFALKTNETIDRSIRVSMSGMENVIR